MISAGEETASQARTAFQSTISREGRGQPRSLLDSLRYQLNDVTLTPKRSKRHRTSRATLVLGRGQPRSVLSACQSSRPLPGSHMSRSMKRTNSHTHTRSRHRSNNILFVDDSFVVVVFTARRVCIARTVPWQDVFPSVRHTPVFCLNGYTIYPPVFSRSGCSTILVF